MSKYFIRDEVKGVVIGVRQVDRGRIQIPKIIRDKLELDNSDSVYWIELNGNYYIRKAVKIQ